MKVSIKNIIVKEDRRDVDQEKVEELAESIKEVGLINPITLTEDYTLIAGAHRLEACKLLGYTEIEANVLSIDNLRAELAEIDENLIRSELHYIDRGRQLARRKEVYEKLYPETKAGVAGGKASAAKRTNADSAVVEKPSFVEDTSKKINRSTRTIHEDLQIVNNIKPIIQDLIKAKDIPKKDALKLARMDEREQEKIAEKIESGEAKNVRGAIVAINKERANELKKNPVPIPEGKYKTIEIDPPWKLDGEEEKSQVLQYPLMDLEEIKALGEKINELADENCHLYLWVINPMLPEAIEVLKSWEKYGFVYKTCITWVKSNGFGTGHYYRGQTEHVLFAVKGKLDTLRKDQPNYFEAPRYRHSEKPEKFYEIVEFMSPGPRIRLFARSHREGWKSWGDES